MSHPNLQEVKYAGAPRLGYYGGIPSPTTAMDRTRTQGYSGYGLDSVPRTRQHSPNRYNPQFDPHPHHHHQQHILRAPSPHHPLHPRRVSPPPTLNDLFIERDQHYTFQNTLAASVPASNVAANSLLRSTLIWVDLEPWMDEDYAKRVTKLMGWEPLTVNIPQTQPDPATGQQSNNPGYCFLTFATQAQAASALAQLNSAGVPPLAMPNSNQPFILNWASNAQSSDIPSSASPASYTLTPSNSAYPQHPKEYSIFVGDLAPETSNSDLVAVFRNPVLGLRNDREPKFIRPFLSCKSAKIMLDPVTGVSRGYGFVRFAEEADQQRALIEMHGLYCLSRPMRISPATAKFKPGTLASPFGNGADHQQATIDIPINSSQTQNVSTPVAATTVNGSGSNSSSNSSVPSLMGSGSGATSPTYSSISSEEILNLPPNVLAQIAQQYANGNTGGKISPSKTADGVPATTFAPESNAPRYTLSEESWKHHAQARAILGNLIGPNGEQLTSADPYNTTVFVGGLSPLVSEDALRSFFAPFGEIHYVKVPVGKHCGFVQFVRKVDAERAIDKMQGFPVGGSRIRLSWGRSQYKAAQAAAQAAQAAALQSQFVPPNPLSTALTSEQALQLLQKLSMQPYANPTGNLNTASCSEASGSEGRVPMAPQPHSSRSFDDHRPLSWSDAVGDFGPQIYSGRPAQNQQNHNETRPSRSHTITSFSPFSPEISTQSDVVRRDSVPLSRVSEMLPHPSTSFAPGFGPATSQNLGSNGSLTSPGHSVRPGTLQRFSSFQIGDFTSSFQKPQMMDPPIMRPSSGQTSTPSRAVKFDQKGLVELDFQIQDLNGTLASLDLGSEDHLVVANGSSRSSPRR